MYRDSVDSISECCDFCNMNPACNVWSLQLELKRCFLKSTRGARLGDTAYISGFSDKCKICFTAYNFKVDLKLTDFSLNIDFGTMSTPIPTTTVPIIRSFTAQTNPSNFKMSNLPWKNSQFKFVIQPNIRMWYIGEYKIRHRLPEPGYKCDPAVVLWLLRRFQHMQVLHLLWLQSNLFALRQRWPGRSSVRAKRNVCLGKNM